MEATKVVGRIFLAFAVVSVLLTSALFQPVALASSVPEIRVIVQGSATGEAEAAVLAVGGWVESDISAIDAVVANLPAHRLDELSADGRVVRVTSDRPVELATSRDHRDSLEGPVDVEFAMPAGIEEVWATGNRGAGVTVAIVDTGVDPRLPELRTDPPGRASRFLAYYDAIGDKLYEHPHLLKSPGDPNGHGSHVAGIIANGSYEASDSQYRGVAPSANIVAIRVLNEDGVGSYSDVLRGIQWAIEHREQYGIRVMNISMYAIPVAPYWADPYSLIVMAAWQAGITVVASAGNTGPAPMSIGVPGNTPYVITVGAFTDHRTPSDFSDDYIPEFSAAGPTLDAFVKPDVVAPGAHIVSLMRPNTTLREAQSGNSVNGQYFEMSGSSMSTAVVSGIAALVLSEHGELSPDQVKYRITQTARPQLAEIDGRPTAAYSIWQQGAGRVWAADAVLTDLKGAANQGLDLAGDLNGDQHYQGWTTYNPESGAFEIVGGGFNDIIDDYTIWDGSFDSWADGWVGGDSNWAGSFDSWADSFDSWADSFDSWADSFDSWADSFDSWADSYTYWESTCVPESGSFDSWADSFDSWADSFDSWADSFDSWADAVAFADSFDSWADSFDSWADSFDSWADGNASSEFCNAWLGSFDSWADGYTGWIAGMESMTGGLSAWTGGFSTWEGGYLTWGTSFDSWADSFDSWADGFGHWASVCSVDTDSFDSWADGFRSWAADPDGSSEPSSFYGWAEDFDSSADSFDSWADSFDSWADSFDSWADSFDSWADSTAVETRPVMCEGWVESFDSWADSFDSWADSFDSWADSTPSLAGYMPTWGGGYTNWSSGWESLTQSGYQTTYGDPGFAESFANTTQTITETPEVAINLWVDLD